MRSINDRFIEDLLHGELSFFLNEVLTSDKQLCVAIRKNYINIYYRGGNLLRIKQKRNGYRFNFDAKYCLNKNNDSQYALLSGLADADIKGYIRHFGLMREEMDSWFAVNPKPEREYQHSLIAENSSVVDIEYQIGKSMRLDMLCVDNGQLYIVENKYGVGAIGGSAGLSKHYNDICSVIDNKAVFAELKESVCHIIEAKRKLGLPVPNKGIDENKPPLILFLFANYNPNSRMIKNEIAKTTVTHPAGYLKLGKDEIQLDITKVKDFFNYED